MRRLYYVTDSLRLCELAGEALKEADVTDWNFHVVSRDRMGLYQHRIHAATTYQQHDVIHSSERYGLLGIGIGLLIGALAYLLQPLPWAVSGFDVALITLAGGLFGAWQGALVGLGRESYKLAPFHDDLEAGRHVLMVDVNDRNRAKVREIMNLRFPSVEFRGRDSTLIGPFANGHQPAPVGLAPVLEQQHAER